jgi:hypothetical protein
MDMAYFDYNHLEFIVTVYIQGGGMGLSVKWAVGKKSVSRIAVGKAAVRKKAVTGLRKLPYQCRLRFLSFKLCNVFFL